MLYMIIVKASTISENKIAPSETLMKEMDHYNNLLMSAGVRIMAKGLHPTSEALRIEFVDGKKIMSKRPFTPENEQISGFFLIEVEDETEAITWFQSVPDPIGENQGIIELRKVY